MDVELAIDMLEMAQFIDHAILFSGDGDFRRGWSRGAAPRRIGVGRCRRSARRRQWISGACACRADPLSVLRDLRPEYGPSHHPHEAPRARLEPVRRGVSAPPPDTAGSSAGPPPSLAQPQISASSRWRKLEMAQPGPRLSALSKMAAFRGSQRAAHPDWFQRAGPRRLARPRPSCLIPRAGAGAARRQPHRANRSPGDYAGTCFARAYAGSAWPRATTTRGRMTGSPSLRRGSPGAVRCVPHRASRSRARSPPAGRCRGGDRQPLRACGLSGAGRRSLHYRWCCRPSGCAARIFSPD